MEGELLFLINYTAPQTVHIFQDIIPCVRKRDNMESQRQLKEACGEAPWYVLHCPSCVGKIADRHNMDPQYLWAIHLTCDTCHSSWWACRYCPTQRSRLTTTGHLSRHRNGKYHLEMVGGREGLQDNTTTTAPVEGQTRNLPRNKNREDNKVVLNPKHFPRTCCTHFFEKTDMGTGLLYLARKAILQSDNAMDNLDPKDVETFLKTAFMCPKLPDHSARPSQDYLHVSASLLANSVRE